MPHPTVYIPSDDLAWIDERTEETGESRSGLVRKAIEHYRECEETPDAEDVNE